MSDFERVERNQLFAEFEQQALRVTRECASEPYGDVPATQIEYFAAFLDGRLPLAPKPGAKAAKAREAFIKYGKEQRPKAVGSLSMGAYFFNRAIGYATLYETREKGSGHYYRLRTVKERDDLPQPAVVISDFAIKPIAPNRSINWLIATRDANDAFLLDRDDRNRPDSREESSWRTWRGTDLTPGSFQPKTEADYERVKLRLLEAATILGKIGSTNLISSVIDLPEKIGWHLALPVVYSSRGPQF